jgi:hypothetical protein
VPKPPADLRPAIELPGQPPRPALLFDDPRTLQISAVEPFTLTLEKRTPAQTL